MWMHRSAWLWEYPSRDWCIICDIVPFFQQFHTSLRRFTVSRSSELQFLLLVTISRTNTPKLKISILGDTSVYCVLRCHITTAEDEQLSLEKSFEANLFNLSIKVVGTLTKLKTTVRGLQIQMFQCKGVSGESLEGDNVLSGSSDNRVSKSGKEITEVSSKEIVVHTNAGPTLMAASLWPCLQVFDKTSSGEKISSEQFQKCSQDSNKTGFLAGVQLEVDRSIEEEVNLNSDEGEILRHKACQELGGLIFPEDEGKSEWMVANKKGGKSRIKEPVAPTRKSSRIQDQGIPMQEKAAMLKSIQNLETPVLQRSLGLFGLSGTKGLWREFFLNNLPKLFSNFYLVCSVGKSYSKILTEGS